MKITVLTADYAQADASGKINAIGLGWTTVGTPLPPHSVAIILGVDWHEANERHQFVLELVDEDGHPVAFTEDGRVMAVTPDAGEDLLPAVRVEGDFEVGRPPGVAKGTMLTNAVAITLPGNMPLPAGKRFSYRVSVASTVEQHSFAVVQMF